MMNELKKQISTNRIILITMVVGQIVPVIATLVLLELDMIGNRTSIQNIFFYLTPIISLVLIALGFLVFNHKIKLIKGSGSLNSRLDIFQKAFIIRLTFLCSVGIFSGIAFFLTQEYFHLVFCGITILIQIATTPNTSQLTSLLDLNSIEQKSVINGGNDEKSKTEQKNNKIIWIVAPIILLIPLFHLYNLSDFVEKKEWTPQQIDIMVEQCVKDTGEDGEKYPELAREYCECATDTLIKAFTYEEIWESGDLPKEEHIKLITPIIQNCLVEYRRKVWLQK